MVSSIKIRAQSWWRSLKPSGGELSTRTVLTSAPANRAAPSTHNSAARAWFGAKIPASAPPDYADLFEHAPVGYMLLDDAGCIQQINHPGAAILGWDQNWLMDKPFSRWVINNDKQLFQTHLQGLTNNPQYSSQELRIKNRQGRAVILRLQSRREPTRNNPGAGFRSVGYRSVMVDISGEEQSARRLRRMQTQLAHVARVQTAGELATSLAHELNQPLGTVVLNCEAALRLLNSGQGQEYEFSEALCQATEAASFASDVIRHLRGFLSKNEELHRVCTLPTLIRDITKLIETDARDNDVQLHLDIEPGLSSVRVDSVQIEQVLVNLVHNGIEAMSETDSGGVDMITITVRDDPPGQIRVSVADTGPGMDNKQLTRVFSPFYTTKTGGMGMGLSISRSIIEAHGGRLWAESQSGRGATIHFTLPAVRQNHDQ